MYWTYYATSNREDALVSSITGQRAHGLRQGGFAFIPIESDELLHWLKAARFNNGQLTESVELRIVRQTMAHADSLDLTNPAEAWALTTNVTTTCRQVIVDLWEDTGLTTERTARLSGWVWRNLATMASPAGRRLLADGYGDWVRKIVSMRLGSLFLPMDDPVTGPSRRVCPLAGAIGSPAAATG